ncbi:YdcF family protein [Pseudahrensia aquimaris]|uniref:YdcF family protein n=1 Tax=Pseudahrensia aquimaris TaxID=744461 RepID=A0ABW3FBP3_9HYPH
MDSDSPQSFAPSHDAIVVLGAAVWADEQPSPTLRLRTEHAIHLYQEGTANLMVLCGGLGKNPPSEAEVMAQLCREANVPENALILEDRSTTTLENAKFSAILLAPHKAKRLMIVSDKYHLRRARMVFQSLGFSVETSAPVSRLPLLKRMAASIREAIAMPYYWVRISLNR